MKLTKSALPAAQELLRNLEDNKMNRRTISPTVLDDRITAAFGDGAKSDDVASLIGETEAAAVAMGDVAEQARSRALDPTLSGADVESARLETDGAAFRRDRLAMAVTRLKERLRELRAHEENSRRQVAYDKARVERDRLAAELGRIYPAVVAQLANLMVRVDANDREVDHINAHALPAGAERLLLAELVARGLRGFVENSVEAVSIIRELRLPAFRFDRYDPYAWPPSR